MIKLVTSAAYVNQELAAEFGRLPPAFLPIGVSRLYEAQVAALGGGPIHMTLPESFIPHAADAARLHELGVVLLAVPDGISLAESILYALAVIAAPHEALVLLHGDTLVEDAAPFLEGGDLVAMQAEGDDYSWAAVALDGGRVVALNDVALHDMASGSEHAPPPAVACGLFSFRAIATLMNALARARGDFIRGLTLYAEGNHVRGVAVERWRDFGHLQTYFRSRRMISTARAFNTLRIDAEVARKSSADRAKMAAEMHWLRAVPAPVQPYCARLIAPPQDGAAEDGAAGYATEYLYAPTLAELYVFSAVGPPTWRRILASCERFLTLCAGTTGTTGGAGGGSALMALVGDKTFERLEAYAARGGVPIDRPLGYDGAATPSLLKIAEIARDVVAAAPPRPETVMHGDFCFSNILYNSRTGRINVIDPRGYVRAGRPTIFGDGRYDLAKLAHSVVGRYDHILAGRYALDARGTAFSIGFAGGATSEWLRGAFSDLVVDGVAATDRTVGAITVSLFLSMLPLHNDRPDRQLAFIANALRLFAQLDGAEP